MLLRSRRRNVTTSIRHQTKTKRILHSGDPRVFSCYSCVCLLSAPGFIRPLSAVWVGRRGFGCLLPLEVFTRIILVTLFTLVTSLRCYFITLSGDRPASYIAHMLSVMFFTSLCIPSLMHPLMTDVVIISWRCLFSGHIFWHLGSSYALYVWWLTFRVRSCVISPSNWYHTTIYRSQSHHLLCKSPSLTSFLALSYTNSPSHHLTLTIMSLPPVPVTLYYIYHSRIAITRL